MPVRTRAARRIRASKKRTYRKRVKQSTCRRAGTKYCNRTRSLTRRCRVARGRKRTYCRKRKNKRVRFA